MSLFHHLQEIVAVGLVNPHFQFQDQLIGHSISALILNLLTPLCILFISTLKPAFVPLVYNFCPFEPSCEVL